LPYCVDRLGQWFLAGRQFRNSRATRCGELPEAGVERMIAGYTLRRRPNINWGRSGQPIAKFDATMCGLSFVYYANIGNRPRC
jgi:hypothetical protein